MCYLQVDKAQPYWGLQLYLDGEEYSECHWNEITRPPGAKTRVVPKKAVNRKSIIRKDFPLANFDANGGQAPEGRFEFPVSARLPDHLPASMSARSGSSHCAVRYAVRARMERRARTVPRYNPRTHRRRPSRIINKDETAEAFFTLRYMLCGWGYSSSKITNET